MAGAGYHAAAEEILGQAGERDATALEGVRVVEVGDSVAAAFAGRWLAGLGAEVIALEPPGGVPWRNAPDGSTSSRFAYLGAGKRSAVVALASAADRERAAALFGSAQLLLDGAGPGALAKLGLAPWATPQRWPALASVSVTPFGDTGPFAQLPTAPLALQALSGMLWHVGEPGRPPLNQWGDQIERLAGLHALGAALAALQSGAAVHYEVTLQGCGASAVGHHTGRASQVGTQPGRSSARALWRVYRTADGWAAACALARNYPRLSEAMGVPEISQASPFLDHHQRVAQEERLAEILMPWFRARTSAAIRKLGLAERVPLCPVSSVAEVAASEQLAQRDYFARVVQPGIGALRMPRQLWASAAHGWHSAPAAALDADAALLRAAPNPARSAAARGVDPHAPLRGVRVLDLGQIWAGPYAATLLADQGADVIKVESPSAWDPNRCTAPPPPGREAEFWNTCAYFHEYSRNKRSLGIDLRTARGREVFGRLVASADVVIENLRADVLDRLGIGYAWLCEQRPDVILVSMAGFGKTGPESVMPGYGPTIEALSGIASLTGYGDGQPRMASGYAYGDPVGAVAAACAALTALQVRARTGRGQHVDVAQRDVMAALIGEAFVMESRGEQPAQLGNERPGCAPHGVYPARGDDEWVAIAVQRDAEWEGLRRALGDPDWARAPELARSAARWERRALLDERVASWTRELDKHEVFARLSAAGVPAGPVYKPLELMADPQLAARGFYEPIAHPAMGEWRIHGWDWRPRGAGLCLRRPGPDFGGHNRELLAELGLAAAEIAELEAQGVIAARPQNLPSLA
jgi:crotonobetainyl-CoA:carnitine CoA-transferase CaiB-like acyl-CoA transferase